MAGTHPGQASEIAPHLVRELDPESLTEVGFSDMFELTLAKRTRVRGCFTLWKPTRHLLGPAFEYQRRTQLVTAALHTRPFAVPQAMFPCDQDKPFGAQATRQLLLEKGLQRSISRAGTPTDNGPAERFVGVFKLAGAETLPRLDLGSVPEGCPAVGPVLQDRPAS